MEAFSLLKYWRNGGGGGSNGATTTTTTTTTAFTPASTTKATTKTIVAAAAVSPYSSDGEDGPFFDLEFGVPDHDTDTDEQTSDESHENEVKLLHSEDGDETESEEESVDDEEEEEEETELKFSVTSNECTDQNAAISPSDDLFFKGDLVTIEPSSILLNAGEENSKFPVFLVKSATKFRVLLLKKLKKSKSVNGENPEAAEISGKDEAGVPAPSTPPEIVERENQGKMSGKLFVKLKVEEEAPLANLFGRENSSKAAKQIAQDSDERKVSKEVMNKYLKMVKPFYVRVSKRYVEKLKFSGHSGGVPKAYAASPPPESAAANVKNPQQKQGNNLQAGLKVVRKHLGKSRSASAAAAAAAPPAKAVSDRRDDSLLQLQDGIQGAILHCKKSFNASREVDSSSILSRSVSDPSYEKSVMMPKFLRVSSSTSAEANKKEIIR